MTGHARSAGIAASKRLEVEGPSATPLVRVNPLQNVRVIINIFQKLAEKFVVVEFGQLIRSTGGWIVVHVSLPFLRVKLGRLL